MNNKNEKIVIVKMNNNFIYNNCLAVVVDSMEDTCMIKVMPIGTNTVYKIYKSETQEIKKSTKYTCLTIDTLRKNSKYDWALTQPTKIEFIEITENKWEYTREQRDVNHMPKIDDYRISNIEGNKPYLKKILLEKYIYTFHVIEENKREELKIYNLRSYSGTQIIKAMNNNNILKQSY